MSEKKIFPAWKYYMLKYGFIIFNIPCFLWFSLDEYTCIMKFTNGQYRPMEILENGDVIDIKEAE